MSKSIAFPLLAGLLSGLILGALMTGIPGAMLFLYAVPLPLYLAGFAHGTAAVAIAVAAGTVAATMLGGVAVGGPFLALFGAPAVIVVWRALATATAPDGRRAWPPAGPLLGWLTLLAIGGILAAALLTANAEGGLEGEIRRALPQAVALVFQGPVPEVLTRQIEQLATLFPAMLGSVWILMTALNAIVAQTTLVRRSRSQRPSPDWLGIEAPAWTPYAFSAAVILGAVGPQEIGFLGENLALVLLMPYFFVGIAVIHSLARRTQIRTLALLIFYMLLILLGFIAMVAVAVLGFAEMWLGLRRRVSASGRV